MRHMISKYPYILQLCCIIIGFIILLVNNKNKTTINTIGFTLLFGGMFFVLIEMCYYGCRNENVELNETETETETEIENDNISNTSINSDLNNFFIFNI